MIGVTLTSRRGHILIIETNGARCKRDCFSCNRVNLNRGVLTDVEVAGFEDNA